MSAWAYFAVVATSVWPSTFCASRKLPVSRSRLEAREQAEHREGVNAERDRRIRAGFLYDFGGAIGVRRFDCRHGRDEINWTHVRERVAELVADGQGSTTIDLRCAIDETLSVPASDLAAAFAAMSAWRSAVYAASWALKDNAGGVPADYDDDGYWP